MALTPEERAKKIATHKATKLAEKNATRRARYKAQREKRAVKEKAQGSEDLKALNNERTRTPIPSKAKPTTGTSANNRKWRDKRHERYNAKVWRGWRESDGGPSPVTTYKKNDIDPSTTPSK